MSEPIVEAIRQLRDRTDPRGWRVIVLRFGLDGYDPPSDPALPQGRVRKRNSLEGTVRSLEEVGIEFDVTRERIRQIESRAIKLLRHPSRRRVVEGALAHQMNETKVGRLDFEYSTLMEVLSRYPGEFPAPDRWFAFLSHVFPDVVEFSTPERQLHEPRKLLQQQLEENGGFY